MIEVSASILNCNFLHLEEEIKKVQRAKIDLIHLDIMDGHFVPNLSFGIPILKAIRPIVSVPIFSHLMVVNPESIIEKFIPDSDGIIFHIEATSNPDLCLRLIKNGKKYCGIALNPDTPLKTINPYLDKIYEILIMSVHPGFGGQKFIRTTIDKVKEAKTIIKDRNIKIAVDGGVNPTNAKVLIKAGVDILVAGTAIFKSKNYAKTVRMLKGGQS
ncbi:MAG: ribulose-phosphate 3-epimerase [candidate division WOR-3 bacterium]|nr:ribulose-phosphate 3-epimerase [candidate division WOR-3 bacterium]